MTCSPMIIYCVFQTNSYAYVLFQKITGRKMKYTALVGKPSEITYLHAEHTLNDMAQQIGIKDPIQRLYCIG